jgi:hypothetical protein
MVLDARHFAVPRRLTVGSSIGRRAAWRQSDSGLVMENAAASPVAGQVGRHTNSRLKAGPRNASAGASIAAKGRALRRHNPNRHFNPDDLHGAGKRRVMPIRQICRAVNRGGARLGERPQWRKQGLWRAGAVGQIQPVQAFSPGADQSRPRQRRL